MSSFQLFALLAAGGLLLLASDLRRLRRKIREIAAGDGEETAKATQQEWLLVRNLRLMLPLDAVVAAIGLFRMLQQSGFLDDLVDSQVLVGLFWALLAAIVAVFYVWSFRGAPARLRRWLFAFPAP